MAKQDVTAKLRGNIIIAISIHQMPVATDALDGLPSSGNAPEVREKAAFWPATRGGKQVAGEPCEQADRDHNEQVRRQAVFALSQLPGPEASTQLATTQHPVSPR
jgi:HEAT repeat protein